MANYLYEEAESVLKSYGKTEKRGKSLVGACPVCGDDHHLYISRGKNGICLTFCQKCKAGAKEIFAAWENDGHKPTVTTSNTNEPQKEWTPGATWYPYKDETGELAFYKKRKEYYEISPDGTKERKKAISFWHADKITKGQPAEYKNALHIYNLHELATAEPGTVYIVEGEKCANSLTKNGILAITTKGGANIGTDTVKLTVRETELVNRHKRIIIIPDNDEAGWSYVEAWAKYVPNLLLLDVKKLNLNAPNKYDIADWITDGGNVAELEQVEVVPYSKDLSPYAEKWNGAFISNARKKVIDLLTDSEPGTNEPDLEAQAAEVLDPAEWQPEDFKDGKKLRAIFNCIYANDDDDLLEALKNRASDLKISRISQRWVKYRDERKKQESAAMVAEKVNGLRILPEAAGLKTGPYHITTSGIIKEVENKDTVQLVDIFPAPVLPVGILTNIETGYVKTRLWWKPANRKAREEIFENRILADKSKILMLADRGLPVDSLNALDLVEYLSVIRAKNGAAIPNEDSVSSLGWHNNNKTFAPYDQEQIIDNITENITIYRSIKSKGTFEEWADFMAQRLTDKRLHIVMAASFGSVILRLVGALPFILHFWGKTGTGKTVALMAAASVWGNPEAGAYLRSMDATTNAVMKLAGFLRNLPVVADEMQTVRDREGDYDKFIMRVTEGIERGRLNADSSLKPLQEWSTIFITSGEEPIVNIKSGAGAVNRVIEVELEPDQPLFPGEMGNEVANFCREHYGTAGPELICQIKKLGPELLKEAYKSCSKNLMGNNITAKQALSAAAILTGSRLMCNLVFKGKLEPLQTCDIVPYLKTELTVDPAERAYSTLINLFAANRNRFESKRDTGTMIYEYEPGQGETWGKVFDGGYFVNKSILERELQNIGFQFDAVKKAWAGKGYLIKDSQGKYSHQRTEAGVYCNYIYMVSKPTET